MADSKQHKLICGVTRSGIERPFLTILGAALVAAAAIYLASGLEIRSSFEELLPSDLPSVALVKQLARMSTDTNDRPYRPVKINHITIQKAGAAARAATPAKKPAAATTPKAGTTPK